jgi:hypothetical protein
VLPIVPLAMHILVVSAPPLLGQRDNFDFHNVLSD